MDAERLNRKAHALRVSRDLVNKYVNESLLMAADISKTVDDGTYDLEDYTLHVRGGYVQVVPKEST